MPCADPCGRAARSPAIAVQGTASHKLREIRRSGVKPGEAAEARRPPRAYGAECGIPPRQRRGGRSASTGGMGTMTREKRFAHLPVTALYCRHALHHRHTSGTGGRVLGGSTRVTGMRVARRNVGRPSETTPCLRSPQCLRRRSRMPCAAGKGGRGLPQSEGSNVRSGRCSPGAVSPGERRMRRARRRSRRRHGYGGAKAGGYTRKSVQP